MTDQTTNRGYPRVAGTRHFNEDVLVLRAMLDLIDADMQAAFNAIATKTGLASPAFTGTPTVPTPASGDDSNQIANTAFVKAALTLGFANFIGAAPAALDTWIELVTAVQNDETALSALTTLVGSKANSADVYLKATVDTLLAAKLDRNGDNFASNAERLALANAGKMLSLLAQAISTADAKQVRANLLGGFGVPDAVLQDQKAYGTPGGTSAAGIQTRTLNTKVRDAFGDISLSTNKFTPAVDMWCDFSAPSYGAGRNQAYIYNETDSAIAISGTSDSNNTIYQSHSRSTGAGQLTAGKQYSLRHNISNSLANYGLGSDASGASFEVYSFVKLWRI